MTDSREKKEAPVKRYPTLGCCGIDCGLCPRFYTAGTSRCPGCCGPDFFQKHPSCLFITCCVKKKKLDVCAQCGEFPCPRFEGWDAGEAFVTHQKTIANLRFIREHGLAEFLEQHRRRIALLQKMLEGFDDGRSRSFYCLASALLPIAGLERSWHEAELLTKKSDDIKARASILRKCLNDWAKETDVELKLRSK